MEACTSGGRWGGGENVGECCRFWDRALLVLDTLPYDPQGDHQDEPAAVQTTVVADVPKVAESGQGQGSNHGMFKVGEGVAGGSRNWHQRTSLNVIHSPLLGSGLQSATVAWWAHSAVLPLEQLILTLQPGVTVTVVWGFQFASPDPWGNIQLDWW